MFSKVAGVSKVSLDYFHSSHVILGNLPLFVYIESIKLFHYITKIYLFHAFDSSRKFILLREPFLKTKAKHAFTSVIQG